MVCRILDSDGDSLAVANTMAELREQIQRAGMETAYREARSLPFQAIATLALIMVDRVDQALIRYTHPL